MVTRNVVLTDHMETVINELVLSGRYQNASEVMREGLRLLKQHEAEQRAKLDALRKATSKGLMELEQGHYVDVSAEERDQFFENMGDEIARSSTENH